MKPGLLDINVLLALAWPTHQHHQDAHAWFHRESKHGWASCALTQLGFVRLSSNPAYTPDAVSPQDAVSLLERLTSHAKHRFWTDLPPIDVRAIRHAGGHRQVMDAYLVQIARHYKARVITLDRRLAAHAVAGDDVSTIGSG